MELTTKLKHLPIFLKKYKYPVLIILIGLILLSLPEFNSGQAVTTDPDTASTVKNDLEVRLSTILSLIDGAGEVQVILSVEAGEEVIYQTNENQNSSDSSTNTKSDTVTITAADRATVGLIKQVNPEVFKGALVVCPGADDPTVRLAIVDGISKLTGLGANQISVLKMK